MNGGAGLLTLSSYNTSMVPTVTTIQVQRITKGKPSFPRRRLVTWLLSSGDVNTEFISSPLIRRLLVAKHATGVHPLFTSFRSLSAGNYSDNYQCCWFAPLAFAWLGTVGNCRVCVCLCVCVCVCACACVARDMALISCDWDGDGWWKGLKMHKR